MNYRSHRLRTAVTVLLLASASAAQEAQPAKVKGPDYSVRGGEYGVLNNLMLYDAQKVEYVGTEETEAYGVKYTAARFRVINAVYFSASGKDQCADDGVCQVKEDAEFSVLVGLDESGKVHDQMLKRIHDYWSANKPIKWKKADADEHVNYKDGQYVMFLAPPMRYVKSRTKSLVWVDGKVIKFEFRRFLHAPTQYGNGYNLSKGGEALENFVGSGIRLRVGGVEIQARQMKGSFREEFFKLYDGGAFAGAN